MHINKFLFSICFLIFSCDLPNEADSDCNGISLGTAYVDVCGRCVGGNTGFIEGEDKDACGICFGDGECGVCSDINAINYIEAEGELANNDLCLYDLCEEYIFNYDNSYECDSSQSDAVYQVGDQLRCEDVLDDLDLCFPSNCGETFNFSKVYGKVIWLELTASW